MARSFTLLLLAFSAAIACHGEPRTQHEQLHHHGTLHDIAGQPSSAGILVTITELPSGREIVVSQTDKLGHFLLPEARGDYAFAMVSRNGFAFSKKTVTAAYDVSLELSSTCFQMHGIVSGAMVLPTNVSFSRVSRDTGDRFLVPVSASGNFFACLPSGVYSTQLEGAMVSIETPFTIPDEMELKLTGYATATVEQAPRGIRVSGTDLQDFARSLTNVRILGLGEANHGTAEFYEYRGSLSLELARAGKLRLLLLEADSIAMFAIEDYICGKDVDIFKAVEAIKFRITDNHEFLKFLADLREFNSAKSFEQRIHIFGIDAQFLTPPVRFLQTHRIELAVSDYENNLLERIAVDRETGFTKMTAEETQALRSLLEKLSIEARPSDLDGDAVRTAIAARSIRYQLDYLTLGKLRDRAMADLAAYIVGLAPHAQAALWGHNGHIARQSDGATVSVGQHLQHEFGDSYYPIAFLSYSGQGRAWDEAGEIGVIPHELLPTPDFYVESAIMTATGFADVAWARLDEASGALQRWLSSPRYVREFGSAFHPKKTQTLRSFPQSFSAVVVIRRARASTPTPTGVRKIKK